MRLTWLLLRRHRLFLGCWLLLLIAMSAGTVTAYQNTYPTGQQRRIAVALAQDNAATTLIYGRLPGPGTPAQMYVWEIGACTTILTAVFAILLTVSLTRAAEDDGTLELLRSCGLTVDQPLYAATGVLTACAGTLAAGCAVVVGVHGGHADGVTWAGSAAYGSVVGLTFLLFAALTMLLAQIAPTAGQARLLAFATMGASFTVRAFADTRPAGWLNWCSPLGLRATVEPFTTDRWTALSAPAAATALAIGAATFVARRREFGAGLLRRRDTRLRRLRIRSTAGLAARLTRASVLTWTTAVATIGTLFAAMGSGAVDQQRDGDIGGFLGAQLGDGEPAAGYLSYCGTVVGIMVCVYAVLSVTASRHAERLGLTDMMLATGARRWAPLASQATVTAAGAAIILAVTAMVTALIAPAVVEGDDITTRALLYTAGQWPAAAAITGCTVLLAGTAPRLTALAWLPLAVSAALALLGDLLEVPPRIQDLGLFGHVPDAAAADSTPVALLVLAGAGALMCLTGLIGMNRRDLVTG
ncbi:hypothetical protein [Paractinoplanes atraurantiacus]|uniref:ABC-2 type transport system permease protein n=1 Tax=Paractinoplanes atraurantiacus TaxID=1036182 RepID=A0A285JK81_9ACTN|nr:hypothetical protein [Actinoplanes atraurantiacus]SNY59501.1 ABC-2 type transport system permease protein [Actinoplanes atraurantiacus]